MSELLVVEGVSKYFGMPGRFTLPGRRKEPVRSVDDIDLVVHTGQALAIVGESGSGKTTLGRTIARLYEPTSGRVIFNGADITHWGPRRLRTVRRDMQMVFQDPIGSLNPRARIFDIIEEPLRAQQVRPTARRERAKELMDLVGLSPDYGTRYPHQFSGGQRQRIAIARSLSVNPKLVILDEPVSALDVSIQAQIINLLIDLRAEFGMAYIFISHDLGVVRQIADEVLVMHRGKAVERGTRDEIFDNPQHEYTQKLLSAAPIDHPRDRMRFRASTKEK